MRNFSYLVAPLGVLSRRETNVHQKHVQMEIITHIPGAARRGEGRDAVDKGRPLCPADPPSRPCHPFSQASPKTLSLTPAHRRGGYSTPLNLCVNIYKRVSCGAQRQRGGRNVKTDKFPHVWDVTLPFQRVLCYEISCECLLTRLIQKLKPER